MEIVDAQVHLNRIGTDWQTAEPRDVIERAIVAMDAVGVDAVLIGEYPQGSGAWRTLPNGARRRDYPFSELAVQLYPERFAYHVGVDRRDPEDRRSRWPRYASKPNSLCIRVVPLPATGEIDQFAQGAYEPIWAAAEKYDVPMFVGVPGNIDKLVPYLEKFPQAQVIMDHTATLYAGETPRVTRRGRPFRGVRPRHLAGALPEPVAQVVPCARSHLGRGLSLQRPGASRAPADRRVRSRAGDVGQRLHAGPAAPLVGAGAAPPAGLAHSVRAGSGVDLWQDHPDDPPLAAVRQSKGYTDMTILIEKNVDVPMRDGTVLYRHLSTTDRIRLPTLLQRTPYNKDLPTLVNSSVNVLRVVQSGYAMVVQDTRGRFASQGTFTPFCNEANDGEDTIAWAAAQPWSDGNVGMVGGSYVGATQWLPATRSPAALRATTPFITSADYYEGWTHQGGAFELGFSLNLDPGRSSYWASSCAVSGSSRDHGAVPRPRAGRRRRRSLFWRLPLTDMPALRSARPTTSIGSRIRPMTITGARSHRTNAMSTSPPRR